MARISKIQGKDRKRKVIAATIAGKSSAQIAAELGVAQPTVEHYRSRDQEVRSLLLRLKERNESKIDQLYTMMLDSLGGDIQHADPDVRFRARQEVLRLAALGETQKDGTPDAVAGEIDVERALGLWMIETRKAKVITATAEVSLDS